MLATRKYVGFSLGAFALLIVTTHIWAICGISQPSLFQSPGIRREGNYQAEILPISPQQSTLKADDVDATSPQDDAKQQSGLTRNLNAVGQTVRFIHIPKTAGTSIVHTGLALNYSWGNYDRPLQEQARIRNSTDPMCKCRFSWHRPPHCMPGYFQDAIVFTAIRHPTMRFLSEMCYLNNLYQWNLNNTELIKKAESMIDTELDRPQEWHCHFVPQHYYTPAAQHLLRHETIDEDFAAFAHNVLQLEATLQKRNLSPDSCNSITPAHLHIDSLTKLELFYINDFRLLGYQPYSHAISL